MLNISNSKDMSEVGTISVSIFKDENTGFSAFNINSDDSVLQFSYAIEDTLKKF